MEEQNCATPSAQTARLAVDHGHVLHYELCGPPEGLPVLCLHGGPGSGCGPRLKTLYDTARHRVVFLDQRGAGRSTPAGQTEHNRTADLIADIERLRRHLGVDRWLVTGGSWGAALALAYASMHRQAVSGLLLRASFLTGDADLDWFFGQAAADAPGAWARLRQAWQEELPGREVPTALCRALADPDQAALVAHAWQCYEAALCLPGAPPPPAPHDAAARQALVARYRLQATYLSRRCDLGEAALLAAARELQGVPCLILHGLQDRVCRPENARKLQAALPGARLRWIEGAGHDPFHPDMQAAFLEAQRGFKPRTGFGS